MIESHVFHRSAPVLPHNNQGVTPKPRPVFRMVDAGERMGGSMPVWDRKSSAQEKIADQLARAAHLPPSPHAAHGGQAALAYRASPAPVSTPPEPFGFGDLIDMINPLHHIPVVGNFYRHVTGDEIRGSSRILGGALFGGPLGALGSFANVMVEAETGRDILDNVVAHTMPVFMDDDNQTQNPTATASSAPIHTNAQTHALGFATQARSHGTLYYVGDNNSAPARPDQAAAHYQKTHNHPQSEKHAEKLAAAPLELFGTGGFY